MVKHRNLLPTQHYANVVWLWVYLVFCRNAILYVMAKWKELIFGINATFESYTVLEVTTAI